MSYVPDGAVVLVGSLLDLLKIVPEVMLSPQAAREHLPSLLSAHTAVRPESWSSLWFPVTSATLSAALTASELALRVQCVFRWNTANVHVRLLSNDQFLGFLVTRQALPLLDKWRPGADQSDLT
jgi:hypothetical protein